MKKNYKAAGIILILFIHSCTNNKAGQNIENVKKIRIGMAFDSVQLVMGKEDIIIEDSKSYSTDDESYPYISFDYDSTNRVSRIYSPTNAD